MRSFTKVAIAVYCRTPGRLSQNLIVKCSDLSNCLIGLFFKGDQLEWVIFQHRKQYPTSACCEVWMWWTFGFMFLWVVGMRVKFWLTFPFWFSSSLYFFLEASFLLENLDYIFGTGKVDVVLLANVFEGIVHHHNLEDYDAPFLIINL